MYVDMKKLEQMVMLRFLNVEDTENILYRIVKLCVLKIENMEVKFNCKKCGTEKEVEIKIPQTCSVACRVALMREKRKTLVGDTGEIKTDVITSETTTINPIPSTSGTEGNPTVQE